jgi:hypothetical protein
MPSVADMIRDMAPEWSQADTRRATHYAQDMLDTINTWNESAIRDRMTELVRDDRVFAAVVYSMLPRPVRQLLDETQRCA